MNETILFVLLAVSAFAVGWLISQATGFQWFRFKKRTKCLFGFHEPGPARAEVGGRNVQRCDWCSKVVREYKVTKEGAQKNPTIRRIY